MNYQLFKRSICKLAALLTGGFLLAVLCAAVGGSLGLVPTVLLGLPALFLLNGLCGALLPHKEQPAHPAATPRCQVSLRVVRGNRAA